MSELGLAPSPHDDDLHHFPASVPQVDGSDGTDAAQISVGGLLMCVRRVPGTVACLGANWAGELGLVDGDPTRARTITGLVPVRLTTGEELRDAAEVSAGFQHACARRSNATVVCWGGNRARELGDGHDSPPRAEATTVMLDGRTPLSDATQVSAGAHATCARRASGAVFCWGENISGQLGDGTTTARDFPVAVLVDAGTPLADAVDISVGSGFACARRAHGEVVCWGIDRDGGARGAVVDPQRPDAMYATPIQFGDHTPLADATAISAGLHHACAVRQSGEVVCWGSDAFGQLGDRTHKHTYAPVVVQGP